MDYFKFKLSIAFAGQALYIQTLLKLRNLAFVTVLEITRWQIKSPLEPIHGAQAENH